MEIKIVKLPLDIKEKWLEALRSGRYQQGRACLRSSDDKFCCLGVLLDVIDPTKWEINSDSDVYRWNGERSVLPRNIITQYGLTCGTVYIPKQIGANDIGTHTLAGLNDTLKYSFNQIADIIEKEL